MKIINFYNNLQEREKKLLSISMVLIILLFVYFVFSSVYKNYTRSILNLDKAKSDYEYVFSKVQGLQSSYNKKVLDSNVIDRLISSNNLDNSISDLKISSVDKSIYITFSSSNINEAIFLSEKIINTSKNEISNVRYQKLDNIINTKLTFN